MFQTISRKKSGIFVGGGGPPFPKTAGGPGGVGEGSVMIGGAGVPTTATKFVDTFAEKSLLMGGGKGHDMSSLASVGARLHPNVRLHK